MNKEVKWDREEKEREREGDAYIIVGNKAMHWMQNIEKKKKKCCGYMGKYNLCYWICKGCS